MRSVNETLYRLLNEKVYGGQDEFLMTGSFMILQRIYVSMFCKGSMFYALQKVYEIDSKR